MTEPESDLKAEFLSCREELLRALEYNGGTHTLDDVWQGIQDGEFQLWVAPHSVIVTQILQTPQQRILFFFLAAGRMDELEAMYPAVMERGKEVGCTRASISGRPGWARSFLARDSWKATHIVMSKELT